MKHGLSAARLTGHIFMHFWGALFADCHLFSAKCHRMLEINFATNPYDGLSFLDDKLH